MRSLVIACIVAFAADLGSTGFAFTLGAVEANPLMKDWSFLEIVAAKLVVLAALVWASWKPNRWGDFAAWYGSIATGLVAAWNLVQIALYGGIF